MKGLEISGILIGDCFLQIFRFYCTMTYRTIHGTVPDWDQVICRINKYSLKQLLTVASVLTGALFGKRLSDISVQQILCHEFFGSDADRVWSRAQDSFNRATTNFKYHHLIMFNHSQIMALVKLAFLHRPISDSSGQSSLLELGEALLMLNDLLDEDAAQGMPKGSPEYKASMLRFLIANHFSNYSYAMVPSLARAYDLFLTDRSHLRHEHHYVNLPELVHELTGLHPQELWPRAYLLLRTWAAMDSEPLSNTPTAAISRDQFFSGFDFANDDMNRFWDHLAIKAEDLQKTIADEYSTDFKPFHDLVLARQPLIELDGDLYCVSANHLCQKLSESLYHTLVDEKKIPDKKRRGSIRTYLGNVFEDYVISLLRRIYPDSSLAPRIVRPDKLKHDLGLKDAPELCDLAIICPTRVILIEQKTSIMPVDARTGLDVDSVLNYIDTRIIKAASQLHSTINMIEAGKFREHGLDPTWIKRYIPLFLTLEHSISSPFIDRRVRQELRNEGILQSQKTEQLQLIDIGEIEWLEAAVNKGQAIDDLLVRDWADSEQPFHNYWVSKDEQFVREGNAHLIGIFGRLQHHAREYFNAHTKKDSQTL